MLAVMGVTEIPEPALGLPAAHGVKLRAPVDHVVDLHQVDRVGAEQAEGILHLGDALAPSPGPDLGGDESVVPASEVGQQVAGDAFRASVHGRGVDYRGTGIQKGCEDGAPAVAFGGAGTDVEAAPGADADGGDFFAGRRDGSFQHGREPSAFPAHMSAHRLEAAVIPWPVCP
jgi:hypothetical protein